MMGTGESHLAVVVIGAGSAGLAVSRELTVRGVEHLVLEKAQVGQTWRDRWDSFTLVTPNWTMCLPGYPYSGSDPEGHVHRDEIVSYLEEFAAVCSAPVQAGVTVDAISAGQVSRFRLSTSRGPINAEHVVVCTGAFGRAHRPVVERLPVGLLVLEATDYRKPDELPDGAVLLIGSGQTGCQLAEELRLAGRDVFLSCGRAPWAPRRLEDVDIITWMNRVDFYEQKLEDLPSPAARLLANPQATGARGGHDLHFRTLQELGVVLVGRLIGFDGSQVYFAEDLDESVAFGDDRWAEMRNVLTKGLPARGFSVPDLPVPGPFRSAAPTQLDLRHFSTLIFTSGFRPDYRWIDFPHCDDMGFPLTADGASLAVGGLYFCGIHFMRIRRSGTLFGVGDDAALVADAIARDRE